MTRFVVANAQVDRLQIQFQIAGLMKPPQVTAGLAGIFRYEHGIFIVDQVRIFVRQPRAAEGSVATI